MLALMAVKATLSRSGLFDAGDFGHSEGLGLLDRAGDLHFDADHVRAFGNDFALYFFAALERDDISGHWGHSS